MSALRDALGNLSDDVFFDLLESDDDYLLVVDVPGVAVDSIESAVEDDTLSIEAQRRKDLPGDYQYLEENRSLFFDVSLPVPEDAVATNVETAVDRGVLEVRLPKRSASDEATIEVTDDGERDLEESGRTDAEPR